MTGSTALRPLKRPPVSLSHIAKDLSLTAVGSDVEVSGVAMGSRAVIPGDLFVALRGQHRHGSEFWGEAAANGARAVLTDPEGAELLGAYGVPMLVTEDPRALLGAVAALVYGTVSGPLPTLYSVTGTNGKTSTAFLIEALLRGLGRTTALSTTALRLVNGVEFPSTLTTPEAPDTHAMIARAAEEGVSGIALEVSAQALDKNRMDQIVSDVSGFTNLSHDHFEDFGSMDNYLLAKAPLFTQQLSRRAVLCVDSEWGARLATMVTIPQVTLAAAGGPPASWTYQIVEEAEDSTLFQVTSATGVSFQLRAPLRGQHMVANAALAAVMLIETGVHPLDLERHMGPDSQGIPVFIPGRMEKVSAEVGPRVFVDAGRSADAYENTLQALRARTQGQLIMVCGTSGNRDATKRPIMGRTAAELADVVIVTDDDPRKEDPDAIRQGLLEGARSVRGATVHEIPDPSSAIRFAVSLASEEDTILWSGPGSQNYRDIGGVKVPYSAREEARQALREAGWTSI